MSRAAEKAAKPAMYQAVLGSFPRALTELAKCGEKGKKKHGDYNAYLHSDYPAEGFMDAACRHMAGCITEGEINHADGGLYHKAQAAWSLLASLEKDLIESEKHNGNRSEPPFLYYDRRDCGCTVCTGNGANCVARG